jgi:hypothetical protein
MANQFHCRANGDAILSADARPDSLGITIGKRVGEVKLLANVYEPDEKLHTIIYLPLS